MNLSQCLCSIWRSHQTFDLATKRTCRNTAWNTPQMCPSSVLRRRRFPRNFVRIKTCYLCASHHGIQWHCDPEHLLQNFNHQSIQPTNFAWFKYFVHVDNNAELKKKTTTHNQNLPHNQNPLAAHYFFLSEFGLILLGAVLLWRTTHSLPSEEGTGVLWVSTGTHQCDAPIQTRWWQHQRASPLLAWLFMEWKFPVVNVAVDHRLVVSRICPLTQLLDHIRFTAVMGDC